MTSSVNPTETRNRPLNNELLNRFRTRLKAINPVTRVGKVHEIVITTLRAVLPDVMQGELCEIICTDGRRLLGEVVAFTANEVTISCLEAVDGISLGATVIPLGCRHSVESHAGIIGQMLDGMGRNMNVPGDRSVQALSFASGSSPVMRQAPSASERPPIQDQLVTGVRVGDYDCHDHDPFGKITISKVRGCTG